MKKTHPTKKLLFFSFMFFLFTCLFFVFLLIRIKFNEEDTRRINFDWQVESERREEVRSLSFFIKQISKEKETFESYFVNESTLVNFLNVLEGVGNSVGVSVEVNSFEPQRDSTTGLILNIKSAGDFVSLYKFIKLLENSPYEMEVISLDMQKLGFLNDVSAKSNWSASISIRLVNYLQTL